MAKVLSCFNACAVVGDGATGGQSGASPAASADALPVASLTELAPVYTLEGEGSCVHAHVVVMTMMRRMLRACACIASSLP
jgi:hypothetical protein